MLLPASMLCLARGFAPARDLCDSFETAPAQAGAQLGGRCNQLQGFTNWTPAGAGVVRKQVRLRLSQRSRLRGNIGAG
ncbi:hypothetical protein BW41_01868 [Sphingomonas sp. RIT328]|nr:hypothetical protein BW41_01823 [Sphingomonas sp. RIT328]EZP53727.1 hypothetical protein BW41_01868 [Sphingomonas sp. RIT328]